MVSWTASNDCVVCWAVPGRNKRLLAWLWEDKALTACIILFGKQATNENVNLAPKVIRDLARELKNLDDSPPEDIKVYVNEENFSNVTADIDGPRIVLETFFHILSSLLRR